MFALCNGCTLPLLMFALCNGCRDITDITESYSASGADLITKACVPCKAEAFASPAFNASQPHNNNNIK